MSCFPKRKNDNDEKVSKPNLVAIHNAISYSREVKTERDHIFLPQRFINADVKSNASPSPTCNWVIKPERRFSFLYQRQKSDKTGSAQASLKNLTFEVTKINKRGIKQTRILLVTADGISNIRPNGKVSSVEKWRDVLLSYKVDESTVAIKYTSCQRIYSMSTKAIADDLLSALRKGVNAYEVDARKKGLKSMLDGLDEKERFEAVQIINKKYQKYANEDAIRKCVGQILFSRKSDFFNHKEKICNYVLTEFAEVEQLRKCIDTLKYKLFDENMVKLSAVTNTKDPEIVKYTLNVIQSMIETACLQCHIDNIYKLLEKETGCSNGHKVMKKIFLLSAKTQKFFGIKKMLQSKNEYITAVLELSSFPKKLLPSAKLECLLNTSRHIQHEVKRITRKNILAEDFQPIVIFVLVKASYKTGRIIITASDELFIKYLAYPEGFNDERGYYFCAFCTALELIRSYDYYNIEERFKQLCEWGLT